MVKSAARPKYLDVATAIEKHIHDGQWDGGKLPSVRFVASQYRVSPVTASRALQVLRDKGLIQTIERSGNFRVPSPQAARWALVLRPTPGPWQPATQNITRIGFEALARRQPMHLDESHFHLKTGMTEGDMLALIRAAKDQGIRGAFLLPSRYNDEEMHVDELFLACCRQERLPVVLLERNLRGHNRTLDTDLVAVDDVDGAARCTQHLLDRGRKRIALIVASPTSSHNDRIAGYLYALHSHSCCTSRKTVEHKPIVLRQSDDLPSREVYARLADQVRKQGIDGVVCYVDYTAIGLMVELLARGISVPDDVAVIGFDDLPLGNWFSIGLTTYAYPSEGIAEQAVRLMRERIADSDRTPIKVVIPGWLIVRESTIGNG